jgi:hypothetical protein
MIAGGFGGGASSDARRRTSVIKKSAARFKPTPVRLGEGAEPARAEPEARTEPLITARKNGDLIEAVEVTCTCGKHMVIECLYDARSTENAP